MKLAEAEKQDPVAATEPITGPAPLTPIQRRFFLEAMPNRSHFNQAELLTIPADVSLPALKAALSALLTHHDALRLRFHRTPDSWNAVHGEADAPFEVVDVSRLGESQAKLATEKGAAEAQQSLDIAKGPLVRCVYFNWGANRKGRLLLVIHHLVVDGVSWRILLEDLQTAYNQKVTSQSVTLPPKTTSWQAWSRGLVSFCSSGLIDSANSVLEKDGSGRNKTTSSGS